MTPDALFVLLALLGAFLAVSRRWLSADVSFMSALALVTIAGVIEPTQAVEGFASTAVVALASLYVVAAAVRKSGIVETLLERAPVSKKGMARARGVAARVPVFRILGDRPDPEGDEEARRVEPLVALGVVGALAVLPLTGLLRFETTALLGAMGLVATGRVPAREARRTVDWEIVVLLGAIIGFSQALVASGALSAITNLVAHPDRLFGSSISVAVVLTTIFVFSAFSSRRAAHSVIPLTFSTAILLSSGAGF